MKTLADLVRDTRNARGMTQEELDEALGMGAGYTAQLEVGRIKRPLPDTLRAISRALSIPLDDLGVATKQLDNRREDVVSVLERIDALPTEAARLAAFQELPVAMRRVIRRLAADFLLAASEEVLEPDGSHEGR